MTRTTAWDVWCPHCRRYWYMWRWKAEGKASEYAPKRVCLKCGHLFMAKEMMEDND